MSNSINLYRIVKNKHLNHAFDGEGSRLYGGRWNSKGSACVYCASTESLAQLEMLVHTQSSELLASYSIFELTIENAQVTTLETYPANWQGDPAPSSTANIGDKWLLDNATVALKVPSVIVPRESNFLLNPLHADFDTIVGRASNRSLKFDPRLKD